MISLLIHVRLSIQYLVNSIKIHKQFKKWIKENIKTSHITKTFSPLQEMKYISRLLRFRYRAIESESFDHQ